MCKSMALEVVHLLWHPGNVNEVVGGLAWVADEEVEGFHLKARLLVEDPRVGILLQGVLLVVAIGQVGEGREHALSPKAPPGDLLAPLPIHHYELSVGGVHKERINGARDLNLLRGHAQLHPPGNEALGKDPRIPPPQELPQLGFPRQGARLQSAPC